MAKEKKSFVAYTDWDSTFKKLTDEEAGKLAKMMFSFVNDENPEAPDRITELLFEPIKNQLKRDLKTYEKAIEEKSRKGRLGNLKRWHLDLYNDVSSDKKTLEEAEEIAKHRSSDNSEANDTLATKSSQKIAVIEDVIDIVIDNDILLEKETKECSHENFSEDENFETLPTEEKTKEKNCAKKEKFSEFKKILVDYGAQAQDVDQWFLKRSENKKSINRYLCERLISDCQRNKISVSDALETIARHDWINFEVKWYENAKKTANKASSVTSRGRDNQPRLKSVI